MVLQSDGTFVDQRLAAFESRILFGQKAAKTAKQYSKSPKIPAHIVALITKTGLNYASHSSLRASSLNVSDWLALFQANIEIESAYNTKALSSVGAIGLGQLMPDTASSLGVDPHKPAENLDGSARYLLDMLGKFGSPELALAAYNAGPNAVEKYSGIPPYKETQGHVRKVMAVWERIKKKGA